MNAAMPSFGRRWSVGLLGRLLAILLATMAFEFVASTILYERSSRSLVRDDEAHRLAEHLAIVRTVLSEYPPQDRPAMAARLSTSRYAIRWSILPPAATASPPRTGPIAARVIEWEPVLAGSDLHLSLGTLHRHARLLGAFRLDDGSWVRFGASMPDDRDLAIDRILLALLPAAALLIVGALMFRRTLRPIAGLARATERIGRGGGSTYPEAGPTEVRHLIRAFNAMQARIHQLIGDRTQALAAVGHDLRTPLARLQLRTDAIDDATVRSAFEGDIGEMEAMVGSLLAYLGGEADPEAVVRTDVAVLAATIADDAGDRGDDVTYEGPDHVEAGVRPVGLKRALGNLVDNAVHYGGRARIALHADDTMLVFVVEDDGPGIAPARIADALRPFSRLDPARGRNTRGLGLGLAIVQRVAEREGGTLTLANRAEGGLRAELRLPRR